MGRYTYDNVTQNWKRWNPDTLSYTEKTWQNGIKMLVISGQQPLAYGNLPIHENTMVDTVVMTFSNPEIRDFKEGKIDIVHHSVYLP